MVATMTLLLALPTLSNAFVNLDDRLYVSERPVADGLTAESIRFAFASVGRVYWHPLAWLSSELDTGLFGSAPAGHHFTSILIHAITAGLLVLVLMYLGAGPWTAGAGSLLWAIHPLRVESFAWIAERKDVLCALFFVAAVLAYLRFAERPSRSRYAAWLICGALALMSKPTAVSLPFILLLLDYWPHPRAAKLTRLIVEKLPLVAMCAVVAYLTVIGQAESKATTLIQVSIATRLGNAAISLVRYLGKMLWPVDLACFYPYNRHPAATAIAASVALLIGITILPIQQRKRRPWLLVGWAWFVVALLPNIGIVQAGRQSLGDRFTLLPMIGIVIAVVFTVAEWTAARPERRRPVAWATCAVLAFLAVLTVRQIGFWRDTTTLFKHAIAVENSDFIQGGLGHELLMAGRPEAAAPHLLEAIRLAPEKWEYHNNLANVLLRTGRVDQAYREAQIALQLAPGELPPAETNAIVMLRREDYAGALVQLNRAVELGGDSGSIAAKLSDAGASLASRGRPREAEPLIRRAIKLDPVLVQARRNLVLVLEDQGHVAEARAALQQAIEATGAHREYSGLAAELNVASTPSQAVRPD